MGTRRDIIKKVETEFRSGLHQVKLEDLPFEIQMRTGCSWGKALGDANGIRIRCRVTTLLESAYSRQR